jgi:hypothetical protein
VFYELLQENKYSGISESEYGSDSEINVNISLGDEQSVSSDEKENLTHRQIQVLRDHIFHLLSSLA